MASTSIRAALAADPDVGAGNVLHKLIEHGAALDGPGIAFDVAVDGFPAWQGLTLGELRDRAAARAAWLHAYGISRRDPVAIYVTSSADCFLNWMGLVWLGAIPALMNPNIPGDIAAAYIAKLRATALITDAAHIERLTGGEIKHDVGIPVLDAADTGTGDPAQAPAPFKLHADDPIAITHSSGTTRMPTAVVHSHASLFHATRKIRLSGPRAQGTERILSALPAPHAAGIMTINHALSNRSELLFLSQQSDGGVVLDAIEQWKPTGVFGFAVTWSSWPASTSNSTTWTPSRCGSTPATARTSRTSATSSTSAAATPSPVRSGLQLVQPSSGSRAPCSWTGSARPKWGTPRSTSPTGPTPNATAAASACRTSSPTSRCWTPRPARRSPSARSVTSASSRRLSHPATGTTT